MVSAFTHGIPACSFLTYPRRFSPTDFTDGADIRNPCYPCHPWSNPRLVPTTPGWDVWSHEFDANRKPNQMNQDALSCSAPPPQTATDAREPLAPSESDPPL